MALHLGSPPFELVQLSSLPQSEWRGRAVFHPHQQNGDVPVWEETDPEVLDVELCNLYETDRLPMYDVGVVISWEPDPDFADLGVIRVTFLCSDGSTLHYGSDNLWTPKL